MEKTVRNFMIAALAKAGASDEDEFFGKSMKRRDFWDKLCTMGWEKRTQEPEDTDDVYTTAMLTDKEWSDLWTKFLQLIQAQ